MKTEDIESLAELGRGDALREATVQTLSDAEQIIRGMSRHEVKDSQWRDDLEEAYGRIEDALDILRHLRGAQGKTQ